MACAANRHLQGTGGCAVRFAEVVEDFRAVVVAQSGRLDVEFAQAELQDAAVVVQGFAVNGKHAAKQDTVVIEFRGVKAQTTTGEDLAVVVELRAVQVDVAAVGQAATLVVGACCGDV